jgi:hypothetical protein
VPGLDHEQWDVVEHATQAARELLAMRETTTRDPLLLRLRGV